MNCRRMKKNNSKNIQVEIQNRKNEMRIQEKETYAFELKDDDVLLYSSKIVRLLQNDLQDKLKSSDDLQDFDQLKSKITEKQEICWSRFQEHVEDLKNQNLTNLVQSSKPFIFYQNVYGISKVSLETRKWRQNQDFKSAALFLGKTGSGKSTSINRLLGIPGSLHNKGRPPKSALVYRVLGQNIKVLKSIIRMLVLALSVQNYTTPIPTGNFVYCGFCWLW